MTPRLVLASSSRARLRTLTAAGLRPEVVVSGVPEDDVGGTPARQVLELSRRKARAVASGLAPDPAGGPLVLGCDSLLDLDGEAMGKPGTAAEATARWAAMRGRIGHLLTGHCLVDVATGREEAAVARTAVRFASPSDEELAAYVASREPLAVAGGFTLDGLGGWFVDGIEGDPANVVGVSLPLLRGLLATLDVTVTDLWDRD